MLASTEQSRPVVPSVRGWAPRSSVVIAAYNCALTIDEALESVLAQTMQDFELIVVDDGSTDETATRVERYLDDPRVRLHRQHNRGPALARNAGIERASGAYVSMLDSDDLWLPRYLESMVKALELDPAAGFAFTRAWVLERATNRIRRRPWPASVPAAADVRQRLNLLIKHNFIFNAVTVRREVLAEVGAYDPAMAGGEDYELWLRFAAHGYPGAYVPGPLCVVSDRPGARHHEQRRVLVGLRQVFLKLLADSALCAEAVAGVQERLARLERHLQVLEDRHRVSLIAATRRTLAAVTRDWRERRARLKRPPSEVVAAFPSLGSGITTAGTDGTGDR